LEGDFKIVNYNFMNFGAFQDKNNLERNLYSLFTVP
jgi:hypothetical protein